MKRNEARWAPHDAMVAEATIAKVIAWHRREAEWCREQAALYPVGDEMRNRFGARAVGHEWDASKMSTGAWRT